MKSSCRYIICFDLETGGLPNKTSQAFLDVPMVETAMVVIDLETLSIVEKVSAILQDDYKEGLTYAQQAEDVHGITKEIRKEKGLLLKDVYKMWLDLFKKYKNPRQLCTLAGHNIVGFDVPFIKNFFLYMNDDLDNYVKFYIDTMQFAHMAAIEQQDYKLGTCCGLAGVDLVNAHRALDDTCANAELLMSYIRNLRGEGEKGVSQTITAASETESRFRHSFEI